MDTIIKPDIDDEIKEVVEDIYGKAARMIQDTEKVAPAAFIISEGERDVKVLPIKHLDGPFEKDMTALTLTIMASKMNAKYMITVMEAWMTDLRGHITDDLSMQHAIEWKQSLLKVPSKHPAGKECLIIEVMQKKPCLSWRYVAPIHRFHGVPYLEEDMPEELQCDFVEGRFANLLSDERVAKANRHVEAVLHRVTERLLP